ncbi:MAG: DMT family transporter [Patescibacteria group bacterium]
MVWLIWTAVAYGMNAVAVLIDKSLFFTRTIRQPAAYVVTICTLGLLVFVLAPWGFVVPDSWSLILSALAGLFFTVALWLLFISLQQGEASRVTSFIGAWSPIFVLIVSYFLIGEKLSLLQFSAFVLLVVGGFLIVNGKGGLTRNTLVTALSSALGFALFYTLSKQVFTEIGFIPGLIWIRVTSFLVALLLLLIPTTWPALKASFKVKVQAKLAFFTGQAAAAGSAILVNYAISLGSVTLVNALQGLQYVFLLILVALLSFKRPVLLKEELGGGILVRKLMAIVLIGGGLALIAYSV